MFEKNARTPLIFLSTRRLSHERGCLLDLVRRTSCVTNEGPFHHFLLNQSLMARLRSSYCLNFLHCLVTAMLLGPDLTNFSILSVAWFVIRTVLAFSFTVLNIVALLPAILVVGFLRRDPRIVQKCVECFLYILFVLHLDVVLDLRISSECRLVRCVDLHVVFGASIRVCETCKWIQEFMSAGVGELVIKQAGSTVRIEFRYPG